MLDLHISQYCSLGIAQAEMNLSLNMYIYSGFATHFGPFKSFSSTQQLNLIFLEVCSMFVLLGGFLPFNDGFRLFITVAHKCTLNLKRHSKF